MTALDAEPQTEEPSQVVPARRRRRRPAPKGNPILLAVFPLLLVAAGVAVFLLWQEGTRAVLDTTDGQAVEVVTDPAEPGFLAFVEPMPTMLVAHVDGDDALVGVTVLARTALDEGGTLVILSTDLLIEQANGEGVVLGPLYSAEGIAGLERVVGEFFGFGFTDAPVVMDPADLELWLRLVEPIPFSLLDDLEEVASDGTEEVVIEAGNREFDSTTLASVYGWRNSDEVDAARFARQEAIWLAWLGRVGDAEDPIAVTTIFEVGLPPYLRALGTGTADVSDAPMSPLGFDPVRPIYTITGDNLTWPVEKAQEMVPLPVGHRPGARPTVQVLDGTGDQRNRSDMIPVLVAAGAEISVIGNAPAFGVEETTVAYHRVEFETVAVGFAAAIDASLVYDEDPNQPVDLTVTIGSDVSE
jgi:hypothetical protein